MQFLPRWLHSFLVLMVCTLVISSCGKPAEIPIPEPSPTAPPVERIDTRPASRSGRYNPSIRFERIGIEQGLSHSSVTAILQDSQGFLWFGTEDGLNRYDGYSFKVYRPDADDPASISDRWVTAMTEDNDGNLWIGTRQGGLNRFDPRSGLFTVHRHDPSQETGLSADWIHTLWFDSRGFLWVGTSEGLDRFDPETRTFTHLTTKDGLTSNRVNVLYEDRLGRLWIGSDKGLTRYDLDGESFQGFTSDAENSTGLVSDNIKSIQEDTDGNLWIGTPRGLERMDRYTGLFKLYLHDDEDPNSLASDVVNCLYLDRAGGFWIGTNNGLDFFDARTDRFVHYRNQPSNGTSLSDNTIYSIHEDESRVLWVGTYTGGLNKYNRQQDRFTYYRHDPENTNGLGGNMISAIHVEAGGIVWVGTAGNGLERLNPVTGRFTHYRHDPENTNSLSGDEIYSIQMDRNGFLWVGTSRALDRLDPRTGEFVHYRTGLKENNEIGLSALPVYAIYEDAAGLLWFGTSNGLDQFEPLSDTFIHYSLSANENENQVIALAEDGRGRLWVGTFDGGLHRLNRSEEGFVDYHHDPNLATSLANNTVYSIHEDRRGNLWIGTGGGLDLYDPTNDIFIHRTDKDGLPNNVIYGILEDDAGDLWMSTNNGLSRFDPVGNQYRNFTSSDGLQSNEFNMSACAFSSRGELYFGGINGLNSVRPLEITDSTYNPPIILTSLSQEGKAIPVNQQIQYVRDISLTWPQNQFEFEFAALAYGQPSRNQYAYMLENFDSGWNYIGSKRNGRYTNLPAGTYTLLLNGTNSDERWSESPLRITVTVIPPLWETTWFRILLGIVLVTVIAGGYRLRLTTVQRRNLELTNLVGERTQALNKRSTEMEALYLADERILHAVSINQVFQTLVNVAVEMLQADRSAVFAWDEDQAYIVPRVSYGFSPRTLSVMKFRRGEGIVGRVMESSEPSIVPEIVPDDLHPELRDAIIEEGLQSFVHLPIKVDTRVIAVFNVGFTRPDAINEDIVRLFTALVQRASLSIANMQLFEQTKDLAVMDARNRLARDLHDSAKQKAFAALAQLGTANGILERSPAGVKPHLLEAENLVYEVIQELSFLIQEIYPMALQAKGLSTTLRDYIFEWENRNDIPIKLDIQDSRFLELETEQAVYRTIQESLANMARHSKAARGEVSLIYQPDVLEVTISDNGVGFDIDRKNEGMGLRSIRERVGRIHGVIQVQSTPGEGTRILIQIPIKKAETERKQT
jgi:ligand-binding sensor domain-containing protein/signal transduction histidine kinase